LSSLSKSCKIKVLTTVLILVTLRSNSYGQNLIFYGLQPNISVTKELTSKWEAIMTSYSFIHPWGNKEYDVYYRPINWQFYLQSGLSYKLHSFLRVESGYVFQRTNSSGIENDHTLENRAWEGVMSDIPLSKKISFLQRLRCEERFLFNWSQDNRVFNIRLRYRVGLKIKLGWKQREKKPYYLICYNEIFAVPYGPTNAFFNENRFYFGIGYTLNSTYRIETGYFMQYLIRDPQRDYRILNLFQLSWLINLK